MKAKIIIFLSLIAFVAIGLQAQTYNVKFNKSEITRSITRIEPGDTITGTQTLGKIFKLDEIEQDYKFLYQMAADSMHADSTVYFIVSGSIDGVKYYPLDSITWSLSTPDTTVLFENVTGVRWNFLQGSIKGNGTGTKAKIGRQILRIGY